MSSYSRSVGGEPFSLHADSEHVLHAALSSLWRRKLLIAALVAAALAVGIAVGLLMPQRYTAEAYIRGVATASDAVAGDGEGRNATSISLDLGRMIETQSILLRSHQLARRVVEQLGLERLRPEVGKIGWTEFSDETADARDHQEDIAASRLLSRLSVTTDSRAYLITLGYTSRDPDLAVLITNAFVAEILRSIKLQILSQQRSSTQASLSESLATFGDKFPRVIEAKLQLAAINSLLKKWHGESREEILRSAGENVTQATALPSTRRRLVVALHLLIGVAISIGVALWLERARWWSALSRYGVETTEGLDSITLSQAAKLLVAARLAKRQNALLAATAKDMLNPSKFSIGEQQRHLPRPRRSS